MTTELEGQRNRLRRLAKAVGSPCTPLLAEGFDIGQGPWIAQVDGTSMQGRTPTDAVSRLISTFTHRIRGVLDFARQSMEDAESKLASLENLHYVSATDPERAP